MLQQLQGNRVVKIKLHTLKVVWRTSIVILFTYFPFLDTSTVCLKTEFIHKTFLYKKNVAKKLIKIIRLFGPQLMYKKIIKTGNYLFISILVEYKNLLG